MKIINFLSSVHFTDIFSTVQKKTIQKCSMPLILFKNWDSENLANQDEFSDCHYHTYIGTLVHYNFIGKMGLNYSSAGK